MSRHQNPFANFCTRLHVGCSNIHTLQLCTVLSVYRVDVAPRIVLPCEGLRRFGELNILYLVPCLGRRRFRHDEFSRNFSLFMLCGCEHLTLECPTDTHIIVFNFRIGWSMFFAYSFPFWEYVEMNIAKNWSITAKCFGKLKNNKNDR